MQAHHDILQIIYQIIKEDPQPLSYQCKPRELILRSMQDWNSIHLQLSLLEKEELIMTKQLDTLIIQITEKGWQAINDQESSSAIRAMDI
jgi:predicted transcriptional regulator